MEAGGGAIARLRSLSVGGPCDSSYNTASAPPFGRRHRTRQSTQAQQASALSPLSEACSRRLCPLPASPTRCPVQSSTHITSEGLACPAQRHPSTSAISLSNLISHRAHSLTHSPPSNFSTIAISLAHNTLNLTSDTPHTRIFASIASHLISLHLSLSLVSTHFNLSIHRPSAKCLRSSRFRPILTYPLFLDRLSSHPPTNPPFHSQTEPFTSTLRRAIPFFGSPSLLARRRENTNSGSDTTCPQSTFILPLLLSLSNPLAL